MRHDNVHPPAEQLLRYGDGELSSKDSEQVRWHLEACWQCRTEHEEFQKAVGDCMRYRKVAAELMPAPPRPWFDIRVRMSAIDSVELARPGVFQSIHAFFARPLRLAPVALTLVAAGWVTYTLRYAPAVKAAELLNRASVAEAKVLKPRQIRIKTAGRVVTRLVAPKAVPAAAFQNDNQLATLFRDAHYDWDDPLSAKSFSEWRAGLASKSDSVDSVGTGYRISTTTDSNDLSAASLTLAADLHATEANFQFTGRERVEISEIPDYQTAIATTGQPAAPISPVAPLGAPLNPTAPVAPATSTVSDELQVFARLHRLGTDLGEPVEVVRSGRIVTVKGIALDADRQQQIRTALDGVASVAFDFSETGTLGVNEEQAARTVAASGSASPLRTHLEQNIGGHAAFEVFSSRVLDSTDQLMARVHALRRLAAHFPPPVEAELTASDRQSLAQIRDSHATVLTGLATQVHRSVQPELAALGGSQGSATGAVTPASSWQSGAEQIFESARRVERLLGSVLGGAASPVPADELPSQLLTELASLKSLAEAYH